MILFSKNANPWLVGLYWVAIVLGMSYFVEAVVDEKWRVLVVSAGLYIIGVGSLLYTRAHPKHPQQ